jgi:succinyl-CoA synthetase beta subunit
LKLHEYQSKQLFAQRGIPILKGKVATTPDQARDIAQELGGRVVVKAQVLVGGRGKAGGVKVAKDSKQAEEYAAQILAMNIKGLPVRKVLLDQAAEIKTEIYLGVTNDRANKSPVIIASMAGGVEIETVAIESPDKIIREYVNPYLGLRDYQVRNIAAAIGLPHEHWKAFGQIAAGLVQVYWDTDATLAEINPLIISGGDQLIALDGKIVLDDNALYRHPDLAEMRDLDEEDPAETEARRYGLSYVKLDGEIGCMVNGAGLAMATMDIISYFGGTPANFLDVGGGANAEKVAAALRIILSDKNVKAVLFNIFGGITRCDEVAKGILKAMNEVPTQVPMVVRLVGTNEAEGRKLLADANMETASTLADAAQKAVAAAKGK